MQVGKSRRWLYLGAVLCLASATGCASGNKIKLPWQKTAQAQPPMESHAVHGQPAGTATVPPYSQASKTPPPQSGSTTGQQFDPSQHPDAGKPLDGDASTVDSPQLPVMQRVQFGPLQ